MINNNYNTPVKEIQITALDFAAQGWHVLPCKPSKAPYTEHGKDDATTDPETIRNWAKRWPGALVGIACEKSGIFALDIDIDEPKGINGFYSLAGLIDGAGSGQALLPKVGPVQETPRGGQHYIFKLPSDVKIPNTAGLLGPGLDLRSNGYICTGDGYKWLPGHGPETPLTDAPAWLLDRIRKLTEKPTEPRTIAPVRNNGNDPTKSGDHWLQRALAMAVQGTRNQTGFWLGCQLRDSNVPQAEAELIASEYAARVPGSGYLEFEAVNSIRSAYSAAARAPARGNGGGIEKYGVEMAYVKSSLEHTTEPTDLSPTTPTPGVYKLDDIGNGERFIARHGHKLRYVLEWGWLVWNSKYWEKDRGRVATWAKETARSLFAEAANCESDQLREAIVKFAKSSASQGKRAAMVDAGASEPGIPAAPEDFDINPWLLNVQNGILDLKTGELRPHDPQAMLIKIAGTYYDPEATCPRWKAFLQRVFDGDQELIEFVQRAVGYSMTGDIGEQCLFFLYGIGANGKSTFTGVIQDMLGDYGMKTRVETLMENKRDVITEEVAALNGVRFMLASELAEGQRLNEGLIKDLTGGDRLRARFLYHDSFEFKPIAKPWLYGNHKPVIKGDDEGVWRRPRLVPFNVVIPPEERDHELPAKLAAELPGILAWAVRGCLEYQNGGLKSPKAVTDATQAYRIESDIMGAFLGECTITDPDARAKAGELYKRYETWCKDSGEEKDKLTGTAFGRRMKEREGIDSTKVSGHVWYLGIGLVDESASN